MVEASEGKERKAKKEEKGKEKGKGQGKEEQGRKAKVTIYAQVRNLSFFLVGGVLFYYLLIMKLLEIIGLREPSSGLGVGLDLRFSVMTPAFRDGLLWASICIDESSIKSAELFWSLFGVGIFELSWIYLEVILEFILKLSWS